MKQLKFEGSFIDVMSTFFVISKPSAEGNYETCDKIHVKLFS